MDLKKRVPRSFPSVDALSETKARKESKRLREAIAYHDARYYGDDRPAISDAAYDRLFRRLVELEEAFPKLRTPDSPTRRVGGVRLESLARVEHVAPMLSLDAVQTSREVTSFDRFVREQSKEPARYALEPKFDGFSVEIVYRDGIFEHGATRGDGQIGEDISENLKTIRTIPLRLQRRRTAPALLAVRGEVFLRKRGFQEMNKERIRAGEEPFANPRNAAAGMMRQLDSSKLAGRPFDVVFYDVLRTEGCAFASHRETLQAFGDWGLKTDAHNTSARTIREIERFHASLFEERDALEYEIDGIVIKLDDLGLRARLGTRHRSPRWALAWKFPPREEITRLEEIVVQVGRTGVLTPVALLDPVDVGGVTVSRATLHNEEEIARKDVRVGDRVRIARAGDVIPEVVERLKQPGRPRGRPFRMPRRCPSCGEPLMREGAYRVCPAGLACPAQLVGRLLHYASRDALDIEGLGRETARQLVERGWVRSVANLYALDAGRLTRLEGFAARSATSLERAIQRSKSPRLDRLVYGLGIPRVGRRTAQLLAERFRSLEAIVEVSQEELMKIDGIGPEVAQAVTRFFGEPANRRVLRGLARAGVRAAPTGRRRRRTLEGSTFVFTGRLAGFTRAEAERAVEALGGRATSSVSGETDYLVVGDGPGTKLDEARRQGVKLLDEAQFRRLLGS